MPQCRVEISVFMRNNNCPAERLIKHKAGADKIRANRSPDSRDTGEVSRVIGSKQLSKVFLGLKKRLIYRSRSPILATWFTLEI